MATLAFNAASFRAQFPNQFPDPPNTDALLETYWDAAICYISDNTSRFMTTACRRQAINYMVAHLIFIADAATLGEQVGFITSGQIDKISVSVQEFPAENYWQAFLNTSPYGMQLYALLYVSSVGGFYFGGRNELGAFRRSGGQFTPPSTAGGAPVVDDELLECNLVTVPPLAPFTLDFGTISGGANVTLSALIPAGCGTITCEFDGIGAGDAVVISVWSGFASDTGNRFNVFYWDSDERAAASPPGSTSTDVDVTGATMGAGFILSSISTGTTGANPNLLAITGFMSDAEQNINIDIQVT